MFPVVSIGILPTSIGIFSLVQGHLFTLQLALVHSACETFKISVVYAAVGTGVREATRRRTAIKEGKNPKKEDAILSQN